MCIFVIIKNLKEIKMKKTMNSVEIIVREICNGVVMPHLKLEFLNKYNLVKKKNISEYVVGIHVEYVICKEKIDTAGELVFYFNNIEK